MRMNISLWIFNFKTKCFEMATLWFFVFGGRQWTPYVDKPTAVPDSSFFTVHNSTAQACLDCVRMEARCDALLEPWRSHCNQIIDSALLAQTSDCDVCSFVGAADLPKGLALASVLQACGTVCTAPSAETFPQHMRGYARPYLALS